MTTRAQLQAKLAAEVRSKARQTKRYNHIAKVSHPKSKLESKQQHGFPSRMRGVILPLPNHGVSGYPTTGLAGDYNLQFSTPSVPEPRRITPFSNYNLAYTGQPMEAYHNNNEYASSIGVEMTPDMLSGFQSNIYPNTSASTRHALDTLEDYFETEIYHSENRLRALAHQRGSAQEETLLEQRKQEGYGSGDPNIHHITDIQDEGLDPTSIHSNIYAPITETPQQGGGAAFITPSTGARHDYYSDDGSVNSVPSISNIKTPRGRVDYNVMYDRTTPAARPSGNVSIAVHPSMQGPEGATVNHDGGWTFDLVNQGEPITLTDLPPAAEIPVQEWGPAILTNRTAHYSRPAGNVTMSLHQHV